MSAARPESDIELGIYGSKWKHGYIPLNAAAVALKRKKLHGHGGSHRALAGHLRSEAAIRAHAAKTGRPVSEVRDEYRAHGPARAAIEERMVAARSRRDRADTAQRSSGAALSRARAMGRPRGNGSDETQRSQMAHLRAAAVAHGNATPQPTADDLQRAADNFKREHGAAAVATHNREILRAAKDEAERRYVNTEPEKPAASIRIEHSAEGTLVHGTERGDTATHTALKANGFKWSGRLSAWYLPRTWQHATRSQRVSRLKSALGDKAEVHVPESEARKLSPDEQVARIKAEAAARAERHSARAERLRAEADAQFDRADLREEKSGIPFGQPILVGHHSEGRHRRAIEKAHAAMGRGVAAQNEADAAESRARHAQSVADNYDRPDVAARRLERNEAELRSRIRNNGNPERIAELRAQVERDRAVVGEPKYGKHNVKPGDTVHIGNRSYVVARTGPKAFVPMLDEQRGIPMSNVRKDWRQVTGHTPKVAPEPDERSKALTIKAIADSTGVGQARVSHHEGNTYKIGPGPKEGLYRLHGLPRGGVRAKRVGDLPEGTPDPVDELYGSGRARLASLSARAATHMGQSGHLVYGRDRRGRKVRVFVPGERADADKVKSNIFTGRPTFEGTAAANKPKTDFVPMGAHSSPIHDVNGTELVVHRPNTNPMFARHEGHQVETIHGEGLGTIRKTENGFEIRSHNENEMPAHEVKTRREALAGFAALAAKRERVRAEVKNETERRASEIRAQNDAAKQAAVEAAKAAKREADIRSARAQVARDEANRRRLLTPPPAPRKPVTKDTAAMQAKREAISSRMTMEPIPIAEASKERIKTLAPGHAVKVSEYRRGQATRERTGHVWHVEPGQIHVISMNPDTGRNEILTGRVYNGVARDDFQAQDTAAALANFQEIRNSMPSAEKTVHTTSSSGQYGNGRFKSMREMFAAGTAEFEKRKRAKAVLSPS